MKQNFMEKFAEDIGKKYAKAHDDGFVNGALFMLRMVRKIVDDGLKKAEEDIKKILDKENGEIQKQNKVRINKRSR